MRTVLLASLRSYTRRYVSALLAVGIAVAFVVVTDALASSARNGMTAEVGKPFESADLVVSGPDLRFGPPLDAVDPVLAEAETLGASTAPMGAAWTTIRDAEGRTLGSQSRIGTWADDPALAWQTLTAGRAPQAPDEAVADAERARAAEVEIGDRVQIGEGDQRLSATVVGLAEPAPTMPAALWVPWSSLDALGSASVDAITVGLPDGADAAEVGERLEDTAADVVVYSPAEAVDERLRQANNDIDVLAILLLLFGAIAAVVSVMVIANTFSILFAQRQREFALLRCVGATRRQVMRSIRLEALALGVLASTLGLALGAGIGAALIALLRGNPAVPMGGIEFSPVWWAAAFAGGVATTVLAAWVPTRTAVRVSPLSALRPQTIGLRTRTGAVRLVLGGVVVALGAVLLAAAVSLESVPVMLLGGTVFFAGVVLLGPLIVPAALRAVGALVARTGPAARIAAANAVRNPRRAAATTASLLVGVTLTTAVLTGMATTRSATAAVLDDEYPVDASISATTDDAGLAALDDAVVERVEASAESARVAALPGTVVRVAPDDELAADGIELAERAVLVSGGESVLRGGGSQQPDDGEVLVSGDALGAGLVPDEVSVEAGGRSLTLTTRWAGGLGDVLVVAPSTLEALGGASGTGALWVRAADGADAAALQADVESAAVGRALQAETPLAQRDWLDTQLDVVVWTVVGLLGIGVVIALIGIANTLGLSVLERARENALLRALGLTRRQLRRTLAAEGLLLSVVATLIGTAVGVLFAVIGVRTMIQPSIESAPLVLPWGQLGATVAIAAIAGLAACVLPARRAARVAPAAGLAAD